MPIREVASRIYVVCREIETFCSFLFNSDLPSYFSDHIITFSKDITKYSFPDYFWRSICERHPTLKTYPLGDSIERAFKRTIAILLNNDDIGDDISDDINNVLLTIFKSNPALLDYLLFNFITQLLFELCIVDVRSQKIRKFDFGYAYHFSDGKVVTIEDQENVRNGLISQCEDITNTILPYLQTAVQPNSNSSVHTIIDGINQALSSELNGSNGNSERAQKPTINVIVGTKPKSEINVDYFVEQGSIRLVLDGEKKNVSFDIQDIESFVGHPIHSLTKDFLEIAFVIYLSDIYVQRQTDLSRSLNIFMPVRHLDIWNIIRPYLEKTVSFLARDHINIHFSKKRGVCDNLDDIGPFPNDNKCICLLSGGLDSTVGAIWTLEHNLSPSFVSYSPGILSGIQKTIVNSIEGIYGKSMDHLIISWQGSKKRKGSFRLKDKDDSILKQHLRSFFYLALAVSTAVESNCNTAFIFENGPLAINPLLSESHINTYTAHPQFIETYQTMIDLIFGDVIHIENPFLYKTKGEIAQYLANNDSTDLVKLTSSCMNYARIKTLAPRLNINDFQGRHDGDCLPCIYRRVAIDFAQISETDDVDYLIDAFNIFDSPLFLRMPEHSLNDLIIIADLLRFCQSVLSSTENKLIINVPDLSLSVKDVDSNELIEMYKRHASQTLQSFYNRFSQQSQSVYRTVFQP